MEVTDIDSIEQNYLNNGFSKVELNKYLEIKNAREEIKEYLQTLKKNKNIS